MNNKDIEFRVELLDCKDKNHLPITVSIFADSQDANHVKKYIMDEKHNLFGHASGPDGEYY